MKPSNAAVAMSGTPAFNPCGLVVCVDAAEARLMRRMGYTCITSVKIRRILCAILSSGAENAEQEAVEVVRRLGGVSSADNPADWLMWFKFKQSFPAIRDAFTHIPVIPTPLRDPKNVTDMGDAETWPCKSTTVLVAQDTVELVRVADTYAGSDCYRHKGRMDEPFTPQPGRVCLITQKELRLLRLDGTDTTIVFTYDMELEAMAERDVTPWPTSLRALCGENPALAVGIATGLVAGRYGTPFFLGLTRGPVGTRTFKSDPLEDDGALIMAVETNRKAEYLTRTEYVWEGGEDLRYLVQFGGLTIYTGLRQRRKVQLRSLGLARAGELAGAAIYGLDANRNTLWAWVATRTFTKKDASQRARNQRRVRSTQTPPEYAGGAIMIQYNPPGVFGRRVREEAIKLQNMMVGDGGALLAVPLKTSREGGTYYLNGRATTKDGEILIDQKRCKIRCPLFVPDNPAAMLEWLAKEEPHVIMAGLEPNGQVFAVIKVANGTEDQQRAATRCWSEEMGRRFTATDGRVCSWVPGSTAYDAPVTINAIYYTNWRAESLKTSQFERYRTQGDYGKPLKLARRGGATLSARARAYADMVEGLDEEGMRNWCLSSAILNIRSKFGREALTEVLPRLLEKSTLPNKEKNKMAIRMLHDRGAAARKEAQ